ncbi:ABC-2 type transport system ATP-binding protein [Marininema mesophilum]|uniref:ABC-2 type transport system ATP-binding protein n=1 Tax=Marininema mesophilum TaxID=1048340 RepID=A0A1H2T6G4_9BACL|nr:ABC transporter ATP-binding protein [Marininema mesophilum]SDW39305.1 ABC-2 type transport system ATP-binding protein [Marininema mesophilum]
MKKEPVLRTHNLTKVIGKKKIVDHVDLEIYPGEVFGFLGPNGAGKTSTIRMLVGLASITEGEVFIAGVNLAKNFEKAISYVGGIVENPEMYKFLTGYQNLIHYWRMCKGVPKSRIDEVTRLVGLEKRINDKVKTYSLGMRQRLGIAQALLHSPSLLILDEPTNGLDPAGVREFRDYLRRLAREDNLAVMVSSHLLAEMELMCDRIGVIQDGRLIDVKEMTEFKNEGKGALLIDAHPIDKVMQVVEKFLGIEAIEQDGNLLVEVDREQIPALNAQLVKEDIKVYAISQVSETLEDRFLEMTGGRSVG